MKFRKLFLQMKPISKQQHKSQKKQEKKRAEAK